jgi:hypothetical protein
MRPREAPKAGDTARSVSGISTHIVSSCGDLPVYRKAWSTNSMLYSCRRGVWMTAWVMAAAAIRSPAFAEPPSAAPSGTPPAVAQDNQRTMAMSTDRRGVMRPRVRLRPAALLRSHTEAPVATYPGFRILPDGRTQVFVDLSRSATVKERRDGSTLTYVLRGARILARNNTNPLITTHFSTPVDRARLVRAGDDIDFVVDLRTDAGASYEVVASEQGGARLEVTFAAGQYPPGKPRTFEPRAPRDRDREREATPLIGDLQDTAPSPVTGKRDDANESQPSAADPANPAKNAPADSASAPKEPVPDENGASPPAPHP